MLHNIHVCCRHIITCGNDGDVHVYNGFNDDDPVSYRIGDAVFCVCFKVLYFIIFILSLTSTLLLLMLQAHNWLKI